jgi:hypothetical protein
MVVVGGDGSGVGRWIENDERKKRTWKKAENRGADKRQIGYFDVVNEGNKRFIISYCTLKQFSFTHSVQPLHIHIPPHTAIACT